MRVKWWNEWRRAKGASRQDKYRMIEQDKRTKRRWKKQSGSLWPWNDQNFIEQNRLKRIRKRLCVNQGHCWVEFMIGCKTGQSPWKVQHGKPIETGSLGRINHSREQTLYLIKRANQSKINVNKLQGQTTECWCTAASNNVQYRGKRTCSWLFKCILPNHAIEAHVTGNSLSGANTRTLWMSVLWCSWHYRWPTVVKIAQLRDCNEISTVSGYWKRGRRALLAFILLCIM